MVLGSREQWMEPRWWRRSQTVQGLSLFQPDDLPTLGWRLRLQRQTALADLGSRLVQHELQLEG